MTIEKQSEDSGVNVHLDPTECELFMRLARDAAQVTYAPTDPTYFSVCVKLGQGIGAMFNQPVERTGGRSDTLSNRMVALLLGEDTFPV